jgi:arylsulfatase A-like enzyme
MMGQSKRPNVVLFLADDLGFRDVGYQGSRIETPNIDRLSKAGLRMNRFHAFPLCSPTRAALLTGRNPVRYALVYSVVRPWSHYGLSPEEKTIADVFHAAGYQTAITGKWHLGHTHARLLPNARGFDHFYGHLNGAIDYFEHTRGDAPDWQRNGETVKEKGYSTDLVAAEASRWIQKRDRSKPFFLYVPWNAPHGPLQAPDDLIQKYASIREPKRRTYAAMVTAMDRGIGSVVQTLEQEKILDDTIVVFLSDNGGPRGAGADNGDLRAGKANVFEGGVRVPALIHWPKALKPGASEQVATVLDLLPTLAAAAGVPVSGTKPLDGMNLWPLLEAGKTEPRQELFFAVQAETGPKQHALRSGDWKYIRIDASDKGPEQEFLFNVVEDPTEKNDRSKEQPEKVKDLKQRMAKWIALHPPSEIIVSQHPHPGWVPPSDWSKAYVK